MTRPDPKSFDQGVEAVAADLERRAALWANSNAGEPTQTPVTLLRAVAASARLLKIKDGAAQ